MKVSNLCKNLRDWHMGRFCYMPKASLYCLMYGIRPDSALSYLVNEANILTAVCSAAVVAIFGTPIMQTIALYAFVSHIALPAMFHCMHRKTLGSILTIESVLGGNDGIEIDKQLEQDLKSKSSEVHRLAEFLRNSNLSINTVSPDSLRLFYKSKDADQPIQDASFSPEQEKKILNASTPKERQALIMNYILKKLFSDKEIIGVTEINLMPNNM